MLGTDYDIENNDTATVYSVVGKKLHDKCDFNKALGYYNKALTIRENFGGSDNSRLLSHTMILNYFYTLIESLYRIS